MSAYEIIGLPATLCLDESLLSRSFLQRAKSVHPDAGGDGAVFVALERAYQCLRDPSTRLREWLRVQGREFDPRGGIDSKMVDYFSQLSLFFAELDGFLHKRERASSAIVRAMMESETQQWRQRIEHWQVKLQSDWNVILGRFPEFEKGNDDLAAVELVARDMIFIEKWQSQLRERYARLWA